MSDLAFVDGGSKAPATAVNEAVTDGEASIEVKGSYSTKARHKLGRVCLGNSGHTLQARWFDYASLSKH